MSDNKLSEQTNLGIEFGILIRPFEDLVQETEPPSQSKYRLARAKIHVGFQTWGKRVRGVCTFGEIVLENEVQEIMHPVRWLLSNTDNFVASAESLSEIQTRARGVLDRSKAEFCTAMGNLPIDVPASLDGPNTPFTVHLRIADLIRTTKSRVHYFDRYLTADFFALYLRSLGRDVQVKLITTPGSPQYGIANVQPTAQLAASEFKDFALIQVTRNDLHARHLRIDESIFNLGSGTQHAGVQPTNIDPGDSTAKGHGVLDDIISAGTVVN